MIQEGSRITRLRGTRYLSHCHIAIKRPTSKGRGNGRERRGGERGKKKGWVEVGEGGKEGMKGREIGRGGEGELVPPHDLFAPRPCQYSGRRVTWEST